MSSSRPTNKPTELALRETESHQIAHGLQPFRISIQFDAVENVYILSGPDGSSFWGSRRAFAVRGIISALQMYHDALRRDLIPLPEVEKGGE